VSQQVKQISAAGLTEQSLQTPFSSSVPHAAIANLLALITLALLDKSVTPVAVPVVGNVTSGLL